MGFKTMSLSLTIQKMFAYSTLIFNCSMQSYFDTDNNIPHFKQSRIMGTKPRYLQKF